MIIYILSKLGIKWRKSTKIKMRLQIIFNQSNIITYNLILKKFFYSLFFLRLASLHDNGSQLLENILNDLNLVYLYITC